MPPKPTQYTKDIEHNGRTVTVVDKMNGHDYLDLWGNNNAQEVVEYVTRRETEGDDSSVKEVGEKQ